MVYAVIIAGGLGKRLWPKSRSTCPKFLLKLKGRKTLLQDTVARVRRFIPNDNIIVVTNKKHLRAVYRQLSGFPRKNVIGEPLSKNTAPAVCVAASFVKRRDPNAILYVMPADHIIEDIEATKEILSLASFTAAARDAIVTMGIKPDYPSCGFGYIKTGKLYKNLISDKRYSIYKLDRFIEKPSAKKAKMLLRSKRYLWNSGIFIGKAQTFLDESKRCSPRVYRVVEKIEKSLGTKSQDKALARHYKSFPDISIDYAIMEKTKKAYVIKSEISWKDIGSWKSLDEHLKRDSRGNIITGPCLQMDIKDSIILNEDGHLIASIGLKELVIIRTKDVTLVCPKNRADDVKKLVELAEKKGLKKHI